MQLYSECEFRVMSYVIVIYVTARFPAAVLQIFIWLKKAEFEEKISGDFSQNENRFDHVRCAFSALIENCSPSNTFYTLPWCRLCICTPANWAKWAIVQLLLLWCICTLKYKIQNYFSIVPTSVVLKKCLSVERKKSLNRERLRKSIWNPSWAPCGTL